MEQNINKLEVNLSTGKTQKKPLALSDDVIESSATILANMFLDFIRNGGKMEELTPSNVFGRKK